MKVCALFKYQNGLKFTGVVSDSKEKIIDYLNKKYEQTEKLPDGTKYTFPCWNKDAFEIIEKEIIVL